ncbi:glycoside hydrolase family 9 protein [Natronospora cellulosivora (SeqCode)]
MRGKMLFILIVIFIMLITINIVISAEIIIQEYEAGQLLRRSNFVDGKGFPWHTFVSCRCGSCRYGPDYFVSFDFFAIENRFRSDCDLYFRHSNLTLEEGHTYTVRFTVEAESDLTIYPRIGKQSPPFYDYWNPGGIELKENEIVTIENNFVAEKTYENVEFSFRISTGRRIKFYELSLYNPEFPGYQAKTKPLKRDIRVNQIGYFTNGIKRATLNAMETHPVNWWLKNENGVRVTNGISEVFGYDCQSNEHIHIIDFSFYNLEGENYVLYADSKPVYNEKSLVESYPFTISNDIYDQLTYDALKYFYYHRSGIPIEMPYAENPQFERPASNLPDLLEICTNTRDSWSYHEEFTVDATGGWYEIGNNAKHPRYGAISAWILMNMYERMLYKENSVDLISDNTMNIPESGDGIPDILNEVRWQMEALMSMQVPEGYDREGMVFFSGSDDIWTGLAIYPHEAELITNRILKPPTTDVTLYFAATAAMASRLWQDYDSVFANELLQAAEKAWLASSVNPIIFAPYYIYEPEHFHYGYCYWAAAELFLTTGKEEYKNFVQNSWYYLRASNRIGTKEYVYGLFNPRDVSALGTISLVLVPNGLPEEDILKARENIIYSADYSIYIQEEQGYDPLIRTTLIGFSYNNLGDWVDGYPFYSNLYALNLALLQAYAYDFTDDDKYLNSIIKGFDYILGRNAMEKVYVTSYGSNFVENPYHNIFSNQLDSSFPKPPPGILVSGPSSKLYEYHSYFRFQDEIPAQRRYLDYIEARTNNTCSTILNATLAWVSSYLSLNGNNEIDRVIPGDVNGDGVVNSIDATILGRYILTMIDEFPIENGFQAADINNDGVINSLDYNLIMQVIFNRDI